MPRPPGGGARAGRRRLAAPVKIAVLMGGVSSEREVSLVSGRAVGLALRERGHAVTLLDTRDGEAPLEEAAAPIRPFGAAKGSRAGDGLLRWLAGGGPAKIEVAFLALHGGAGEDGTVQALLEAGGVAYTGSGVLGSALAMHKGVAKRLFREARVRTPDWIEFPGGSAAPPDPGALTSGAHAVGGLPVVVKPASEGSTVGVSIVRDEAGLPRAHAEAASYSSTVIVETFIEGRELAVGVLGDRALPVIEIEPEGGFYDFARKYTAGNTRYTVPAKISAAAASAAQDQAVRACRALHVEGMARVDFRLSGSDEIYCLEVNTIPGMTATSLLPKAAAAAGIGFEDLVETIARAGQAMGRRGTHP